MLETGDVFLAINPGLSGSNAHYHIVVFKTADNLIVVTYTTTQIEKARRQCQRKEKIKFDTIEPETLVIVEPLDSMSFSQRCAIDCNIVQMMPEASYATKPAFKKLQPITNPTLIQRIRDAIKKSRVVEERILKLL
jgi:hypothetical protein